jgi:hypothetical protein
MNMVVAEVVFSELKHEKLKNDTHYGYVVIIMGLGAVTAFHLLDLSFSTNSYVAYYIACPHLPSRPPPPARSVS